MPVFTKDNKSIFFSHIPKTAGTSIERFFQGNEYTKTFYSGHRKPCSLQHRQQGDEELENYLKEVNPIMSFTVMRNPYDRILSQFGMFHKKDTFTEKHFHEYVVKVFEKYQENPFLEDNHIRPQRDFIHKGMKIYKFGEWESMIDDLSNYCDFKNKVLPHTQRSKKWDWEMLPETRELITKFYRDDFKIWKRIKNLHGENYLSV